MRFLVVVVVSLLPLIYVFGKLIAIYTFIARRALLLWLFFPRRALSILPFAVHDNRVYRFSRLFENVSPFRSQHSASLSFAHKLIHFEDHQVLMRNADA